MGVTKMRDLEKSTEADWTAGPHAGPHEFQPLRFWDQWIKAGRCRSCLGPKALHETILREQLWTPARAIGDSRPPLGPLSDDAAAALSDTEA